MVVQSWQQLIYGKYFMTLGLNAGKESGSLTTMVGTGGEHIYRQVRAKDAERGRPVDGKPTDETEEFLNHH